MATLSVQELRGARNHLERSFSPQTWNKPQVNAAVQAIEDTIMVDALAVGSDGQLVQTIVSDAVDVATSPLTFTNPQKKKIFAYWAEARFAADG